MRSKSTFGIRPDQSRAYAVNSIRVPSSSIQKLLLRAASLAFIFVLSTSYAIAEPGVTPTTIRFGLLMPLSSAFDEVGVAYYRGVRAAFDDANRQGGIAGRKLQLIALDTLPFPGETVAQAKEVLTTGIVDEQVLGLIGVVGMQSVAALVPVLESNGTPLIGAVTGLVAYVKDPSGWVFPVRRGDEEVMYGMVRLLENMSVTKLAVVHPPTEDAVRQVQLLRESIKMSKMTLVAQVDAGDTSTELGPQVAYLIASRPESVLALGSYQMTEALIRQLRGAGYKGLFMTHSDVGTRRLITSLREEARGLGVVSGLPSPNSTQLVAGREYRLAIGRQVENARVQVDEASFEGYLAARVVLEGLRQLGANPTRRGLRAALSNHQLEISGLRFDYRKSTDRGLQSPGNLYVVTSDGRISQ